MPVTAGTIRIDGTPTDGADPWVDSLVSGGAWQDSDGGTVTITWSTTRGFMGGEDSLFWSPDEIASLRAALALWEAVANIDFVEVTDAASPNIRFWKGTDNQALGALGWSDLPGYEGAATTNYYVVVNGEESSWHNERAKGGLGFVTLVHEIGHVLGLAHPHDGGRAYDGTNFPGVDTSFDDYGDYGLNQGIYTTMGYNQGWPTFLPGHTSDAYGLQAGPMALDIAAIQTIYGANTNFASGDDVYVLPRFNVVGTYWSTIWDTGGIDTISNAGSSGATTINLNAAVVGAGPGAGGWASYGQTDSGAIVAGGFTIARGVTIENAIGGNGANTLTGNAVANRLEGGSGNDILDGGAGADTMIGGWGYDQYYVDDVGDVIVDYGGNDTVYSAIDFTLTAALENLTLIGAGHVNATGNSQANSLIGNAGNNMIVGGGGADMIDGGAGNDRIVVQDFAFAWARGGDGVDTLVLDGAGHSIYLPSAAMTSKIIGIERFDITGTGNNSLTLDWTTVWDRGQWVGFNHVVVVERDKGDTVNFVEASWTKSGSVVDADGAFDRWVFSNAGLNAEVLVEKDKGQTIIGTTGADVISKSVTVPGQPFATDLGDVIDGGLGADTMNGGDGEDIYFVDNAGDQTIETVNGGIDLVRASISWTLSDNVENLELLAGVVDGTGNGLANWITGNSGDNTLDGGLGADTMVGGLGNDTYVVDNIGDVLTEDAAGGTDTVRSSISWTLQADFENLTLTGASAINGSGNSLGNWLTGNEGANTLTGGAGNDTYVVGFGDIVVEQFGQGTDTVRSSVDFTLGANIEKLVLTGTGDICGTGNAGANILIGNAGANRLDGGAGNDTMAGGFGDDTYVVDVYGELVTEGVGEGTDTVEVWEYWRFEWGPNVEIARQMGTANFGVTGDNQNNIIYGNAGSSSLVGADGDDYLDGGAGNDGLHGGFGDDTYVVDSLGDGVYESLFAGTDTVEAWLSWTLGDNLEHLRLLGTADLNGTGNRESNGLFGNAGKNVLNGGAGADTMTGGLGDDTYVVDSVGDLVIEDLDGGIDLVQSSLSYQLGANVERLLLTGNQTIDGTGNELQNILTGNVASNTLDGGADADTMAGGKGDDSYIVDNAGDVVTELAGGGVDTVFSSVSWTLGAFVERLTLTGSADINGTGTELANVLTGNAGNNKLDGGGGADTMAGGMGDDTYVVDVAGDVVTEAAGEGSDTVEAWLGWTLGANLEQLKLMGTADLNGTGNGLNNALFGNAGKNVLDGKAGADTMSGGLGDDTYVVDQSDDIVVEAAGGGTDLVQASASYQLGANVENLILTGTASIDGTGNDLANTLTGNGGNNVLNGGAGVDTMAGGVGNDTYVVDSAGDVVTEAANQGTDTVEAWLGWTLGANVEQLRLMGTANLDGIGNELKNVLTGNAGNNLLNGGAGADTMAGGLGDDTYVVDNLGDVVTELADGGVDTVLSSVNWTLGANVEKLTLTGTANLAGTGNELGNTLTGNAGNNLLNGGAGADAMAGGLGDDSYVVDSLGDVVTEAAAEGTDTVEAWVGWTLGANFEQLKLLGLDDISAIGNGLNNMLWGNAGKNVLDGKVGADTMAGGQGDDTYIVDNAGDMVTEAVNQGTDTVQSRVDWMLGANFERLVLTGTSGLKGTGNTLANVLTGNAGNNVLDGGAGADAMAGGAGNDTYVVDNAGDGVSELAGEGIDTVLSSLNWTLGANVEKLILTGTANRSGTGNALANTLTGNAGINLLDGGAGADTMAGGLGDDTYIVDDAGDVTIEDAAAGVDTVQSSVTLRLRANLEKLVLTGDANINGTGNELANVLTGNAGNNLLDGGAGADSMTGGLGDDTYVVDHADDRANETPGGGIDTVLSSVSLTLRANLENLVLTGAAAINGYGNGEANILIGNGAANLLDGRTGADTMEGRAGNDIYMVDDAGDVVIEAAGGGADEVQASVSYTLSANVERLKLMGTGDIDATGNGLANNLVGNAGDNRLDGGAGADTMAGGLGDDTYVIDNAKDLANENPGGGIDTVLSSISLSLKPNLENLVLTGTAALNGNGTGEANILTGNAGNNVLDGRAGADTMIGGGGDDTYVVDDAGDLVVEQAGGGSDAVQAWIGYALGANVEKLKLLGTADLDATGNQLANGLTGNGGHNILDGGLGADTLSGGGGGDTFRFSTALGPDNVDRIVAFDHAADTIQLDHTIFASLGLGGLDAGAFNLGAAATQADDRILFHAGSKSLYYDADGLGGAAAIKFATIDTLTGTLDHSDFLIV